MYIHYINFYGIKILLSRHTGSLFIISSKITSQSNNVVANEGRVTLLSNIILEK